MLDLRMIVISIILSGVFFVVGVGIFWYMDFKKEDTFMGRFFGGLLVTSATILFFGMLIENFAIIIKNHVG